MISRGRSDLSTSGCDCRRLWGTIFGGDEVEKQDADKKSDA